MEKSDIPEWLVSQIMREGVEEYISQKDSFAMAIVKVIEEFRDEFDLNQFDMASVLEMAAHSLRDDKLAEEEALLDDDDWDGEQGGSFTTH